MAYKYVLLILLPLISPFISNGQEVHTNSKKDSTSYQQDAALDEVVVTATRTPKFLKDQPVPIQVIGPKQIKLIAPKSFIDLLEFTLPGVEFTQHGFQDQLSYRGFGGDSFLFLIDGDPITTGTSREIDFSRINPDNIERIEVIRGAGSALYGSNALAAVVNIITKRSTQKISASALAFIDTKKNQRYNANLGLNIGKFRSITDFGYIKDQSYKIADENVFQRDVAGNDKLNLSEKLSYRLNDNLELKLSALYNLRKQDRGELMNYEYKSLDLKTGVIWKINDDQSIDLSYSFNTYKRDSILKKSKITPKRKVFNELMHYVRAQYNLDIFDKHHINLGGEYNYDLVSSPRLASPEAPGDKSLNSGVFYGQYQFEPNEKIALSYGGRLDMREKFGVHYTNRISTKYQPNRDYSFRASFSQGYRTPSMQELFFFFDHMGMFYIYGNESLNPEKSNMILLSGEYNTNKVNFTISGYFNKVYNQITLQRKEEANGSFYYYYTNEPKNDRGNIWGFDANLHLNLPWGFSVRGSYAFSYNHFLITMPDGNAYVDANGNKAYTTYTRPHSLVGMISWNKPLSKNYFISSNFSIRYLSPFTSKQLKADPDKDDTYLVENVKYLSATLAKLTVEQRFYDHCELLLGIDNLFNYLPNSAVFNSPLTPGRTFFTTLKLFF